VSIVVAAGKQRKWLTIGAVLMLLCIPLVQSAVSSIVTIPMTGQIVSPAQQVIGYYVAISGSNIVETDRNGATVYTSTNAVSTINHAITDASNSKFAVFIRSGTYSLSSIITMRNNANVTIEDGVVFIHSGNSHIIEFIGVTNASINANSNFEILGAGSSSYDQEIGVFFSGDNNQITLQATQYQGFKIHKTGNCAISTPGSVAHITNSIFKNLYCYDWVRMTNYPWHGILLDGLSNVQFINLVSDAKGPGAPTNNVNTRSCLCIGGQNAPSHDILIQGGLFANSYADNGIYLGGWQQPVYNIQIINVTTQNSNVAGTAHSGLKIRPASNVTVTGWHSIGDYQGCEMGTCYDSSEVSTYNTGGSWYNSMQGIIDSPRNVGLIVGTDGSDKGQSQRYNTFDITVNNAGKGSVWWYNGGVSAGVSNNIIRLVSNGANREAISFEGTINSNTIYGTFANNGKQGYADIAMGGSNNVFNIYSTTGNPNGLYSGSLGSNILNYPYS
jgi:hypothetical protein